MPHVANEADLEVNGHSRNPLNPQNSSSDPTCSTGCSSGTVNSISQYRPHGLQIPLLSIFISQIVVVVAAFVAVVVVLSTRQKSDFESALYSKLIQKQKSSMEAILGPLMERKMNFELLAREFAATHVIEGGRPVSKPPVSPSDNSVLEDAVPFYQQFYSLPRTDPMIRLAGWINESAYEVLDSSGKPTKTWSMFVVDSLKMGVVTKENAVACLGGHPAVLNTLTCPRITVPYNTIESIGDPDLWPPLEAIMSRSSAWSHPGMITDPTLFTKTLGVTYLTTLNGSPIKRPFTVALLVFSLSHIKPVVQRLLSSEESRAGLITNFYDSRYIQHGQYFLTGIVDFPDTIPGRDDSYDSAWKGGSTPDPVLNRAFAEVKRMCYPHDAEALEKGENYLPVSERSPNRTAYFSNYSYAFYNNNRCAGSPVVFEINVGGKHYTVVATRVLYRDMALDWTLVEYTPREVFFASSDRARLVAIIMGVFSAVAIMLLSIFVWAAMRRPLKKLAQDMLLAAKMRNDDVTEQRPILREMGFLIAAFNQMNERLLLARPFLPQATLLVQQEGKGGRGRRTSLLSLQSDRPLFAGLGVGGHDFDGDHYFGLHSFGSLESVGEEMSDVRTNNRDEQKEEGEEEACQASSVSHDSQSTLPRPTSTAAALFPNRRRAHVSLPDLSLQSGATQSGADVTTEGEASRPGVLLAIISDRGKDKRPEEGDSLGIALDESVGARDHNIAFRLPGYEREEQKKQAERGLLTGGRAGREARAVRPATLGVAQPVVAVIPQTLPYVVSNGVGATLSFPTLELRRIAVLSINVRGFHHYSRMGTSSDHFVRVHMALARLVEGTVRSERGVVDYFHGDRFVCGFNTVKVSPCLNPARSAAKASCRLWDAFSDDLLLSGALPSGLAMGLAVGKAEVGNHGTETMQRLGMIGPVFGEAIRLQDIMSRLVLGGGGRACRAERKVARRIVAEAVAKAEAVKQTTTTAAAFKPSPQVHSLGPAAREPEEGDIIDCESSDNYLSAHPSEFEVEEQEVAPPLSSAAATKQANGVAGRCLVLGRTVQELTASMHCQLLGAVDASVLLPSVDCVRHSVRVGYARMRNLQVREALCSPDASHEPCTTTTTTTSSSHEGHSRGGVPAKKASAAERRFLARSLSTRVLIAAIVAPRVVHDSSDEEKAALLFANANINGLGIGIGASAIPVQVSGGVEVKASNGGGEWMYLPNEKEKVEQLEIQKDRNNVTGTAKEVFSTANAAILELFTKGSLVKGIENFQINETLTNGSPTSTSAVSTELPKLSRIQRETGLNGLHVHAPVHVSEEERSGHLTQHFEDKNGSVHPMRGIFASVRRDVERHARDGDSEEVFSRSNSTCSSEFSMVDGDENLHTGKTKLEKNKCCEGCNVKNVAADSCDMHSQTLLFRNAPSAGSHLGREYKEKNEKDQPHRSDQSDSDRVQTAPNSEGFFGVTTSVDKKYSEGTTLFQSSMMSHLTAKAGGVEIEGVRGAATVLLRSVGADNLPRRSSSMFVAGGGPNERNESNFVIPNSNNNNNNNEVGFGTSDRIDFSIDHQLQQVSSGTIAIPDHALGDAFGHSPKLRRRKNTASRITLLSSVANNYLKGDETKTGDGSSDAEKSDGASSNSNGHPPLTGLEISEKEKRVGDEQEMEKGDVGLFFFNAPLPMHVSENVNGIHSQIQTQLFGIPFHNDGDDGDTFDENDVAVRLGDEENPSRLHHEVGIGELGLKVATVGAAPPRRSTQAFHPEGLGLQAYLPAIATPTTLPDTPTPLLTYRYNDNDHRDGCAYESHAIDGLNFIRPLPPTVSEEARVGVSSKSPEEYDVGAQHLCPTVSTFKPLRVGEGESGLHSGEYSASQQSSFLSLGHPAQLKDANKWANVSASLTISSQRPTTLIQRRSGNDHEADSRTNFSNSHNVLPVMRSAAFRETQTHSWNFPAQLKYMSTESSTQQIDNPKIGDACTDTGLFFGGGILPPIVITPATNTTQANPRLLSEANALRGMPGVGLQNVENEVSPFPLSSPAMYPWGVPKISQSKLEDRIKTSADAWHEHLSKVFRSGDPLRAAELLTY